jgi:hypothetical protein
MLGTAFLRQFFCGFEIALETVEPSLLLLVRVDNARWIRLSRKCERNPACWVLIYYYIYSVREGSRGRAKKESVPFMIRPNKKEQRWLSS